ncbi:unnamed protein product, partial [Notodromas monacha]
QQTGGIVTAQNCEVSARVPHNSGAYGVIRVSAPMMNPNPHYLKCQSWMPPQVTNNVQGMTQQPQQMVMSDNHVDVPGNPYRPQNCINPMTQQQMNIQAQQQHHIQLQAAQGGYRMETQGSSAGMAQIDTTGVPTDLDFFDANFSFSGEDQDLFKSLDSIVSHGCPPGGN